MTRKESGGDRVFLNDISQEHTFLRGDGRYVTEMPFLFTYVTWHYGTLNFKDFIE